MGSNWTFFLSPLPLGIGIYTSLLPSKDKGNRRMSEGLLPLDSGGRLGADVIDNAVDSLYFVDDPAGHCS